jgi:hypothetical protein
VLDVLDVEGMRFERQCKGKNGGWETMNDGEIQGRIAKKNGCGQIGNSRAKTG